jgi:hypothetical protein
LISLVCRLNHSLVSLGCRLNHSLISLECFLNHSLISLGYFLNLSLTSLVYRRNLSLTPSHYFLNPSLTSAHHHSHGCSLKLTIQTLLTRGQAILKLFLVSWIPLSITGQHLKLGHIFFLPRPFHLIIFSHAIIWHMQWNMLRVSLN